MRQLLLPPRIGSELIYEFFEAINSHEGDDDLTINLSRLSYVTPGALAAFASVIDRWKRRGRKVDFIGINECPIASYLWRMDLFHHLDIAISDSTNRHNHRGHFVPLRFITHEVDGLAAEVASCFAPGGEDYENPASELFDLIQYLVTETANNVRQHSRGNGFAAAQTRSEEGIIRLSIADNGCGILNSFRINGFDWAQDSSDQYAIEQALKATVSSRGAPINAGVGLTMVHQLVFSLGGWMAVASGSGRAVSKTGCQDIRVSTMPRNAYYHGTLLAVAFKKEVVSDWSQLLEGAKIRAGLLPPGFAGGRFSP